MNNDNDLKFTWHDKIVRLALVNGLQSTSFELQNIALPWLQGRI